MELLDLSQFVDKGHQLKAAYAAAEPFPYIVIDDFLPPELLDAILEEFPNPEELAWIPYDTTKEKTLRSKSELQMGGVNQTTSVPVEFLHFLEFSRDAHGDRRIDPRSSLSREWSAPDSIGRLYENPCGL